MRGRVLASISDGEVGDAWVETFRSWFRNEPLCSCRRMSDAAAKLRLRELDIPHHRVEMEMEFIRRAFVRAVSGPDCASLDSLIEEFQSDRRRPAN